MNRLTNKKLIGLKEDNLCIAVSKEQYRELRNVPDYTKIYDKLGKIEDLLEKYNVNELWELEMILDYYEHRYDSVETRRKEYE